MGTEYLILIADIHLRNRLYIDLSQRPSFCGRPEAHNYWGKKSVHSYTFSCSAIQATQNADGKNGKHWQMEKFSNGNQMQNTVSK